LGGISPSPWQSLNLGVAVGDDSRRVAHNRAILQKALGAVPVFMRQVHGVRVVQWLSQHVLQNLTVKNLELDVAVEEADACVTSVPGIACTIQVADCLPVLFAAPAGRAVGAAHAGWRGLAHGVLESTLRHVCALAQCQPEQVQVWLGPCIGPRQFEVGPDVVQAFHGLSAQGFVQPQWTAYFKPVAAQKWHANLPGLARQRLAAAGVVHLSGGHWCTVEAPAQFFSFRRDGITGRMAATICIQ
jgi:polyphenol oxidase